MRDNMTIHTMKYMNGKRSVIGKAEKKTKKNIIFSTFFWEKSGLHPPTIAKVRFSTFNYET